MLIQDVEVSFVEAPEISRPSVLVKVVAEDGVYGLGELPPWTAYGESNETAATAVRHLYRPRLIGRDPLDYRSIMEELDRVVWCAVQSKALIDIALHDLAGKILRVPVHRLLGGKVRDRIPVVGLVRGGEPEKAAESAATLVQQGFKSVKVGVGGKPEDAIAKVKAVREAIGNLGIRVDAYQSWSKKVAVKTLRRLEALEVELVEQPVHRMNLLDLAEVTRKVDVPISADEGLVLLEDAWQLSRCKAVDVFNIRISKGGYIKALKMANFGELCGIPFLVGSAPEMAIGTTAGAHFASTSGYEYPCELYGSTIFERDIAEGLPVKDGFVDVPNRSGIGVELDEERARPLLKPVR